MTTTTHPALAGLLAALDAGDPDAMPTPVLADWLDDHGLLREPFARRLVLDRPEGDGRRLLYAEAAERAGDGARAEFVRVQVEEARLHTCKCAPSLFVRSGCPVCETVKPLRRRGHKLLLEMTDIFRPPVKYSWAVLGRMPDGNGPGSYVRRGFVERVRCPLAAWEAHGPAVVAGHPVGRVDVTDLEVDHAPGYSTHLAGRVPAWLAKWLKGRHVWEQKGGTWTWVHNDEGRLRDALSRELLAWARAEAEERGMMPC